jgi:acyl carrier protein
LQQKDEITPKVLAAIASVKHISQEDVTRDKTLLDLGFDSLDTINLLFELEEAFHISIPDEEARRVKSVTDVVDGIRKLITPAAAGSTDHAA